MKVFICQNNDVEIWREIEGYKEYSISNYGRIVSFKGRMRIGRILKLFRDTYGYLNVELYKNGGRKRLVHQLVMKTFTPNINPQKYNMINHIDENKQNNHVDNLEWCDNQYNIEYSKSKRYRIQFPDGHEEIIFNLSKFCRENQLQESNAHLNGYHILEKIDKSGKIVKFKKRYKLSFKIQFPDGHEEMIYNLTEFSKQNNLDRNCMHRTLKVNCFHRGYQIIEKIDHP